MLDDVEQGFKEVGAQGLKLCAGIFGAVLDDECQAVSKVVQHAGEVGDDAAVLRGQLAAHEFARRVQSHLLRYVKGGCLRHVLKERQVGDVGILVFQQLVGVD